MKNLSLLTALALAWWHGWEGFSAVITDLDQDVDPQAAHAHWEWFQKQLCPQLMGDFFAELSSGAPTEWITNFRYHYLYQSQVLTELRKYPNNNMGNQQPSTILFIVANTLPHLVAKRLSGFINKFFCTGQKRVWIPWSLALTRLPAKWKLREILQGITCGAPDVSREPSECYSEIHTSRLRSNEVGCISG